MNTYTLIITWNAVDALGYNLTSKHSCGSYDTAMKVVDSYKTSDRFVSAFIKKN